MSSMLITIGFVLDLALQRGFRLDVETTTGRRFDDVLVTALDRFVVVLLDGTRAHVVNREHLVSVSLGQDMVLELVDENAEQEAAG